LGRYPQTFLGNATAGTAAPLVIRGPKAVIEYIERELAATKPGLFVGLEDGIVPEVRLGVAVVVRIREVAT
jgi:hypothetical protein